MNRIELREHVKAIKAAVEAKLPEDEHDDVRTWVYETAVRVMEERLEARVADRVRALLRGTVRGFIAGERHAKKVAALSGEEAGR